MDLKETVNRMSAATWETQSFHSVILHRNEFFLFFCRYTTRVMSDIMIYFDSLALSYHSEKAKTGMKNWQAND